MTDEQQFNQRDSVSCADWNRGRQGSCRSNSNSATLQLGFRQRQLLQSIIETKVIPRLLVAGAAVPIPDAIVPLISKSELAAKIGEFSELVVNQNGDAAIAYFNALRAQGSSVEALFQDLLIPTAVRLGELWEEDINDFFDVTRGLTTLQGLVHNFGEHFVAAGRHSIANKRALLLPVPGEQHGLGISIVSQYFWRAGWRVWGGPPHSHDEIIDLAADQWFDLIGLSASAVNDSGSLARAIREIRKASRNRDVMILVGGHVFNQFPELVREVGGDATAADGHQAVLITNQKLGKSQIAG